MNPILLITILVSFFFTFLATPFWIRRAKRYGLGGVDKHKKNKEKVAEAGGLVVLLGFVLGILIYLGIRTFYFHEDGISNYIFAIMSVLFLSSMVGIIDDLFGWKEGLSKRSRLVLVLFSAIPLMVINAGNSTMMGIEFGIFYPLLIIPLGVLGATTTFNFIAGYNGLEAGQGILILSGLGIVTYLTGNSWLSIVCLCMIASLVGFYIFNKNPAQIFPGDVLTYSVGALIATIAILGNIEKIAIFFFIPYFIEIILKARGKLQKESFAKLNPDGSLNEPYDKIYGLEHLAIRILKKVKKNGKAYENEVVYLINVFQLLIILLGFLFLL